MPTQGWMRQEVALCLLRLSKDDRCEKRFLFPQLVPLEHAQQSIIDSWVVSGEDYWLNIDADNPPRHNPLDRIADDLDLVGFPTPVWHYEGKKGEAPIYWNGYRDAAPEENGYKQWSDRSGLQRVDAIGMGCFLMARRVILDNAALQRGAFQRKWVGGIVERGNDISFCERARECGVEIWMDYDRPCSHIVEVDLFDVVRAHHASNGAS